MGYKRKITKQEHLDRYVAARALETLCKYDQEIKCYPTKISDPVDLQCLLIDPDAMTKKQINVEIKERIKSEENLEKYPWAELKVEKWNGMRAFTPSYAELLYVVLLNRKKAIIFDMFRLDWSKVTQTIWHIKDTQFDDQSEYFDTPILCIPYELADYEVDIEQFYKDYENEDFE